MAGRRMNYGPRFSGSGVGGSQTISQIHGLMRGVSKRYARQQHCEDALLEKARSGAEWAIKLLKKKRLAHRGAASTTRRAKLHPVTKVRFSWDKEDKR